MIKEDPEVSIIIRNVPESIRRALKSKAAAEGNTMNAVILELITRYVGANDEGKGQQTQG
jgi:plasmid stability protein